MMPFITPTFRLCHRNRFRIRNRAPFYLANSEKMSISDGGEIFLRLVSRTK